MTPPRTHRRLAILRYLAASDSHEALRRQAQHIRDAVRAEVDADHNAIRSDLGALVREGLVRTQVLGDVRWWDVTDTGRVALQGGSI